MKLVLSEKISSLNSIFHNICVIRASALFSLSTNRDTIMIVNNFLVTESWTINSGSVCSGKATLKRECVLVLFSAHESRKNSPLYVGDELLSNHSLKNYTKLTPHFFQWKSLPAAQNPLQDELLHTSVHYAVSVLIPVFQSWTTIFESEDFSRRREEIGTTGFFRLGLEQQLPRVHGVQ